MFTFSKEIFRKNFIYQVVIVRKAFIIIFTQLQTKVASEIFLTFLVCVFECYA